MTDNELLGLLYGAQKISGLGLVHEDGAGLE